MDAYKPQDLAQILTREKYSYTAEKIRKNLKTGKKWRILENLGEKRAKNGQNGPTLSSCGGQTIWPRKNLQTPLDAYEPQDSAQILTNKS